MTTRILLALSGGLDSATLLYYALKSNRNVTPFWFSYSSKHEIYEQRAAVSICNNLSLPLTQVNLQWTFAALGIKSDLLKSGGVIPEGHYTDESMKVTIVPCRNLIFLSLLASAAESRDVKEIWIAAHQGDRPIYPDCRPDFIHSVREAINHATDGEVDVVTPFLELDKTDIVREGIRLKVPFELTRTCYKDQVTACGKCGSCTERLEAFRNNRAVDPIIYEDRK
jgi:7-cyano-7-deazaguanine synthase